MKIIRLALISSLGIAPAFADDVNEIMDADSDGTVTVSNVAGSVEIQGWSRSQVEVTGELGSRVEELIFERDGDEILIKVRVPRNRNGGISSDLSISVPVGSSLQVHTVSADITVSDVEGEQELESVSGDVETEAHASDIELGSVSGDVEVQGDNQSIRSRLSTVSGDIDTDSLAGEIDAESVSGDVSAINGSFERAMLNTVNGEIVFRAALLDGGRMDVETVNGSVDIEYDGDVSARFDIETFNGSIRNCFGPDSVRTSRYAPGRELKFTEGGGSGRVTINTLNGSIRLCKN
ncbi:MAG: DUF4097 family beta strand repeat-containing protein [Gammaproteobacteria bacterium]|nr:DUF4097 family beta strand repeat-containing protein [Gammaproteobacteria bacterium]